MKFMLGVNDVQNTFCVPRIPGDRRTQTNYQLSFKGESPFDEYPVGPMQKKVLKMEDVEKLAEEMMATQQ